MKLVDAPNFTVFRSTRHALSFNNPLLKPQGLDPWAIERGRVTRIETRRSGRRITINGKDALALHTGPRESRGTALTNDLDARLGPAHLLQLDASLLNARVAALHDLLRVMFVPARSIVSIGIQEPLYFQRTWAPGSTVGTQTGGRRLCLHSGRRS